MKPGTTLLEFDLAAAKNALSFREPQRVIKIIRLSNGFCFPVCPRCQVSLEREYSKFCDRCGQKLCWIGFGKAKIIDIEAFEVNRENF